MRVLLDTHTILWFSEGNAKLSSLALGILENRSNQILMSPASYWEIAIKVSMGKWEIKDGIEKFLGDCTGDFGFEILAIEPNHAIALSKLPFRQEHRDPFDRLLVCQSMVEEIPLLSADKALDSYGANRIW